MDKSVFVHVVRQYDEKTYVSNTVSSIVRCTDLERGSVESQEREENTESKRVGKQRKARGLLGIEEGLCDEQRRVFGGHLNEMWFVRHYSNEKASEHK
jgi:hypothetical protein